MLRSCNCSERENCFLHLEELVAAEHPRPLNRFSAPLIQITIGLFVPGEGCYVGLDGVQLSSPAFL